MILMTVHLGHQIVLWELTNYPQPRMKLVWFYLLEEKVQPYCSVELMSEHTLMKSHKDLDNTGINYY